VTSKYAQSLVHQYCDLVYQSEVVHAFGNFGTQSRLQCVRDSSSRSDQRRSSIVLVSRQPAVVT